jgi:hypothetical protein
VWDEPGDFGWTHADIGSYADFRWAHGARGASPPLRIVRRESLGITGCGVLFLVAFAMLPLGLLDAVLHRAPITAGLVLVGLLALVFGLFLLGAAAVGVFQVIVPERIESEGDALRLRVEGGFVFRRTDVLLPRSEIAGVALYEVRPGQKEVWLTYVTAGALRVGPTMPAAKAEALYEALAAWLSPRPRARFAEAAAEPLAEQDADEDAARAVRRM